MDTPLDALRKRPSLAKFFADRGTHLAAMVAYFALLSFVPLVFLALALLGLAHRANASSFFVHGAADGLSRGVDHEHPHLVIRVQHNATSLGIIGGVFAPLVVAVALQLPRVCLQHRLRPSQPPFSPGARPSPCLHGRSLVTLFAGLLVGALGAHLFDRFAPGFLGNTVVAYALSVAGLVRSPSFSSCRLGLPRYLTNADLTFRDALPGAIARDCRAGGVVPGGSRCTSGSLKSTLRGCAGLRRPGRCCWSGST